LVRNIGFIVVVAILVGAGGATAAQVITGAQIRNNSVTGKDVRNNSLTGRDVRNKSLTRRDFRGSVRGPRGPQGPQGVQGVQGPVGPSGATNVTVRSGPVEPTGTSIAACNPGERAVGGGGDSAVGFLDSSRPVQEAGQTPTAWRTSAGGDDVQAWVICAAP
jgi:hypothetical protein